MMANANKLRQIKENTGILFKQTKNISKVEINCRNIFKKYAIMKKTRRTYIKGKRPWN